MNAREFFSEILKSADETCELFAGELVDLKWLYCTEGLVAIGINLALWFVLCPFAFGVVLNIFLIESISPSGTLTVFFSLGMVVPVALIKKALRKRKEKEDEKITAKLEEL